MKPLDNYKLNNNILSKNNNMENKGKTLYEKNKPFQYSSYTNNLNSNKRNSKPNFNENSQNNQKKNNYIANRINSTPKPQSNQFNIIPPTNINEKEKDEFDQTQKYINYLKEHLNSSYYANNEINNKNHILAEKSKSLNEEINNNNFLYKKMLKSIEEKINQNNQYKKIYQNFLKEEKKIQNENGNINLNFEEKIKEIKKKNLIINKENKSKEEIISNLKNTLEILEKRKLDKNKEKEDKIKELKEEKSTIAKLKLNIEKITKELYTKKIKLEEKKKSLAYLLNNKINDRSNKLYLNNESTKMINAEINKLENVIENQKMLLIKIKENQKEIKEKINEQEIINKKINASGNLKDNNFKKLLLEEKIKNKELIMNLLKANEEAKNLTKVHNQIKNEYELKLNKIKVEIENILKNKQPNNSNKKGNSDYNAALKQLLEEQKNLKMFNKEFREKLKIKKAIEDKINLMEKENNKLKNIINSSNLNEFNLKNKNGNSYKNLNKKSDEESEEKKKKEKIIQENQIKIESNLINKDSSIYTITDNGKLFTYNIIQKKFTTINTSAIKGWDEFIEIYLSNYEGSLLLNTLNGLYILTGDNFTDLYYYSQKNSISKIISFNYGHKYGGLIISKDNKNLIALGGCDTKEVEILNLENNSIEELPNLLSERINSSYSLIKDNLLYVFFGQNNNTIEYLDLEGSEKEWKNVEFDNKEVNNIYGHISIPVNEDEILIVGGKKNHKMIMFNVKDKFLEITDNKIPFLDTVGEYIFDKDKNYNIITNSNKKEEAESPNNQIICMDSKGNVHLSDKDFNYIVLLVDIHEI